jgi:hypothetical protein
MKEKAGSAALGHGDAGGKKRQFFRDEEKATRTAWAGL